MAPHERSAADDLNEALRYIRCMKPRSTSYGLRMGEDYTGICERLISSAIKKLHENASEESKADYQGRCAICGKTPCDYHGHYPVPVTAVRLTEEA